MKSLTIDLDGEGAWPDFDPRKRRALIEGFREKIRSIAHDLEGQALSMERGREILGLCELIKLQDREKEGLRRFRLFLQSLSRTLEHEAKNAREVQAYFDESLADIPAKPAEGKP